jgi:hypothetical protein
VSSTNSIFSLFEIFVEGRGVMILDEMHTLIIKLLNGLPCLPVLFIMVSILEPLAPMAKVAGYNEQAVRLLEIWQ